MSRRERKLANLSLQSEKSETPPGWQSDLSLVQCNSFLFEHKVAADVTFEVSYTQGKKRAVLSVRAHKTLLLARSPVFFAMFCGQKREVGDVIAVTDVHPDAFTETLRFIYTDTANITAENVLFVMYAAKKYLINNLVLKCSAFLEEQVTPSTVSSVLEHSIFFELEDLTKKSLDLIQRKTKEVLQSDAFLALSSESLGKILDLDELNAEEIDVFNGCLAWAKAECNRKDVPEDGSGLRSVLNPHIAKIRFPTMTLEQFSDSVVETDILTSKEGMGIFRYFTASNKPDKVEPFSLVKRENRFALEQKLLMPGPFQNTVTSYSHNFTVDCNLSDAAELLACYIHQDTAYRQGYQQLQYTLTITNNSSQVYSETLYAYQQSMLDAVTENGQACYKVDLTAKNLRLQPGKTTLNMNYHNSQQRYGIQFSHTTSAAGKVQLQGHHVTVDVESQQPHPLYGLAVKLVA